MSQEEKHKASTSHDEDELELYGEPGIASYNAKIPKFLIFNYIFWPLWGIVTLCYFWNGSMVKWMDPGYWHELQIAANTTFPIENQNMLPQNQESSDKNKSSSANK